MARHLHDADKWVELSEWIAFDQGDEVDAASLPSSLSDLLECEAVQNRGEYAPQLTHSIFKPPITPSTCYISFPHFSTHFDLKGSLERCMLVKLLAYWRNAFDGHSTRVGATLWPNPEVRNKGWFQVTTRCRSLMREWTINQEILRLVRDEQDANNFEAQRQSLSWLSCVTPRNDPCPCPLRQARAMRQEKGQMSKMSLRVMPLAQQP